MLFGIAAVIAWSTVATAFKISLQTLQPLQLLAIAATVSWLFFAATTLVTGEFKQALSLAKAKPFRYLTLGLLNPALYYWILFEAYDLLPAQQAQSINYTWALMLTILSVPLLKQTLTKSDIAACVLGYLGVVLIASGGSLDGFKTTSYLGVALALISTIIWAVYWILNAKQTESGAAAMLIAFSWALPMVWALCLLQDGMPQPSLESALAAVWVGLFEMGVTFVLWLMAMRTAERVSPIANLIFLSPFLSLILIAGVLGEAIVATTLVGLALIIVGTLIQQMSRSKSAP